jgi:hypothetical protein
MEGSKGALTTVYSYLLARNTPIQAVNPAWGKQLPQS